ncbi:MAG TPA: glycoside hydrolase family 125 protein [Lachnospiraceae bacterium]|nr:glycoside hydrolase family 125 protein [Lachnospiraceae bacterium]
MKKAATVEELIEVVKAEFADDKKIGKMFEKCFSNTLDTTVKKLPDNTSFVITGDIPAMWLRDSVCQLRPYLILSGNNEEIAAVIAGLIKRQMEFIQKDPYANAFNEEANGMGHQEDHTEMKPFLWERKYEIDSLCFPLQFSYLYWKNTGKTNIFTEEWKQAAQTIVDTFRREQNHERNSAYFFERDHCPFTDTLSRSGKGALVRPNIGMTWSGFRPSDDACVYGYLVPANMFASVVLCDLQEIAQTVYQDPALADSAGELGNEIKQSIADYAVLKHAEYGEVYAYEVDGYGQYNLMDDANVPSLLSMPYLGFCRENDEIYQNTRRMILSETNPFYFEGKALTGIGSPHIPGKYVWHISKAMEGLTCTDRTRKREIIEQLKNTDAGTFMMHEGVYADDAAQYTRAWFSWANAMFSELVLSYCGYEVIR